MAAFPDTVTLDLRLADDILDFDGLNDVVGMGDVLDQLGSFTIEAWIKPDALPGTAMRILSKDTGTVGWALEIGSGGARVIRFLGREWSTVSHDSSAVLEAGIWQHVAGVFDDTANTVKIYRNAVEVKSSTAVVGSPVDNVAVLSIGANQQGAASYLNGKIRDVRLWNTARTQAQVLANMELELVGNESGLLGYWRLDEGTGTTATDLAAPAQNGTITGATWVKAGGPFWTNVLGDVRVRESIRCKYGIDSDDEAQRTAGAGTLEFGLKNDPSNSGGVTGFYSPGHASVQVGFEIGIETRLAITEGATRFVKHRGRLVRVEPRPGVSGPRDVRCLALDWMGAAVLHKIDLLDLAKNVRSDVFLGRVVDNVPQGPVSRSFGVGQETFAFAGDDLRDERVTAFAAMDRVTLSEFGYTTPIGDTGQGGTLLYQDRHARVKNTTVERTFTQADPVEATLARDESDIRNRVEVVVYPRQVGASPEVLYTLQTTIPLIPGEQRTIKGRYTDSSNRDVRIAGDAMITPVISTDYQFSSSAGGGGDLNAILSVTTDFGATTVEFVLKNIGGVSGFVTKLQARGTAVRTYDPVDMVAEDLTSQLNHFKRTERLTLAYQDEPLVGQDFADNVLSRRKSPKTRLERFTVPAHRSQSLLDACLALEPGDRIAWSESVSAINEQFFINGVELQLLKASEGIAIDFSYWVTPASTEAYWLLGTTGSSELGQTTVLGF